MAERLQQIAHNQNPVSNIYLNDLRVEHFSSRQELLSPLARMRARILLARERLRAGQTQTSIDEFHQLRPELEKRQVRMEPSLDMLLGLAYLRLGEQVNCLEGHTTASCLFPYRSRRRSRRPTRIADGPRPTWPLCWSKTPTI